jgi:hypothetical protein
MKKIILLTAAAVVLSGLAKAQNIFAVNDRIKAYKVALAAERSNDKAAERKTKEGLAQEEKLKRKLENKEVDDRTKLNFSNDFGNVTVLNWLRGPVYNVVNFTRNGQQMEADYGTDSKLVGTITPKVFTDLPAGAQKDIQKHYAGYNPVNVIYYDDNEDNPDVFTLGDDQFTVDNYFVELAKDNRGIVLRVRPDGFVEFFKNMN